MRGVLALSAFSLPLRGREGAGGRGARKRDNRDFGARGRLISRPTENRDSTLDIFKAEGLRTHIRAAKRDPSVNAL